MKIIIMLLTCASITSCASATRRIDPLMARNCGQRAVATYQDCLTKNENTPWATKRERQLADIICYDMMAAQTTLCYR